MAIRGTGEAHLAFLMVMGVPEDEAISTINQAAGLPVRPDKVPPGRWVTPYRVCPECAAKANLPVHDLSAGRLPVYELPADAEDEDDGEAGED